MAIDAFFIPFAGGNKFSYRMFEKIPKSNINMHVLELPGRMMRHKEPLVTDLEELALDIYKQISNKIKGRPYVIYGHSMGAILAYVATVLISKNHLQKPMHLFVTGAEGPSTVRTDKKHLLNDAEFIAELKRLQGSSPDFLMSDELLEFYLPVIRADFQATENYSHKNTLVLDVPITVVTGIDDDMSLDYIELWRKETNQEIQFYRMTGNHFFIFTHASKIIRLMEQVLRRRLENTMSP